MPKALVFKKRPIPDLYCIYRIFVETFKTDSLKGTHMQYSGHIGQFLFQIELMAEIYSKSPVKALGKVLLMKYINNTN